jgi:putative ABC transport system permease protein
MTFREILGRLRAWFRRDQLDRELADDMKAHIELIARDLESGGMSAAAARDAARRQIGNVTALREQSRDAWGFPAIESALQDVRYALRGLRRSPGFTFTVIVTLALGIGANAAMFGVIDRLMFRPLPYMREPGDVNRVYLWTAYQGRPSANNVFPYTRYLDLKRGTSSFANDAAVAEWRLAVGRGDATRVRRVSAVSASFFDFFDAPPARGRYFFAREDSLPMGTLVAVISHPFWVSEFASGDITGRTLKVGTLDYTIVGVTPPGFAGAWTGRPSDVFIPITTFAANMNRSAVGDYWLNYRWDWTEMLVRRKPGVSEEAASADLSSAYIRSRAAARAINPRVLPDSLVHPRAIAGAVRTAAGPQPGAESRVLLWVSGVAGIVLLIACANVANLMFARVLRRRREITVRLALGVSRSRLVMQFVTEALVLALLGGVAGLFVAQWGGVAIRALLLPQGSDFNLATDWRTLGVALGCAIIAAILTAAGPAFVATRTDLAATLKAGVREGTSQRSRVRSALLIAQGAMSVVLLVGAGLFVRSLENVRAVPLGYDPAPILEVTPDFRGSEGDSASRVEVRRRLLAAAQAIQGVEYATRFNSRFFATNTADLRVPGIDSVAKLGRFNLQLGTPDFFKVLGTRILRGRSFDETDRAGTPLVGVVSEAMGRALWPGKDPIGQCFHVAWGDQYGVDKAPCTTVIGIAENTAQQNLGDDPRFMYYLPIEQRSPHQIAALMLRMSDRNASAQMERVRAELTKAMPGDGLVIVRPLQEVVDDQSRSWRLGATLFVAFGGLALVVAIVGLYGVISYNVAQRMHELGVRVALGASTADVTGLVVRQGIVLALAGVVIGLVLAVTAARWIQPLLFRQSATDPITYVVVAAAMLLAALAASLIPAMRAARADPNVALRAD